MAENQSLPDISSVPSLHPADQAGILDLLFEPCAQLRDLSLSLLRERMFDDYTGLIDEVGKLMFGLTESSSAADQARLEAILSAHPRLGEKKTGVQSSAEQAQLHAGGDEQMNALAQCNRDCKA